MRFGLGYVAEFPLNVAHLVGNRSIRNVWVFNQVSGYAYLRLADFVATLPVGYLRSLFTVG